MEAFVGCLPCGAEGFAYFCPAVALLAGGAYGGQLGAGQGVPEGTGSVQGPDGVGPSAVRVDHGPVVQLG